MRMDFTQSSTLLRLGIWLFLYLCLVAPAQAQQRAFTPADTLRIANVADAQIAPDGQRVAYTVTTVEGDANRTVIWLASTQRGSAPSALWPGSVPRWSPDGKRLAFLASKEKQDGLWTVDLTMQPRVPQFVAPVRNTNHFITYAGEAFAWSPDGKSIAYINAEPAPDAKETDNDPRIIDRIQYKSRTSFGDNLRSHVWLVNVDPASAKRGETKALTSGPYYDHALSWNPDGKEIAFLANHEPDPDANNNSDIFAVNLNGGVRQITQTKGCEYEPQWSPDGRYIAYTATTRDVTTIDSVAEDTHVWVIEANASSGSGRDLTAKQDRRARSPRWAENSRKLFFGASDKGQSLIYSVNLSGVVFPIFANYTREIGGPQPKTVFARPFQVTSFSFSKTTIITTSTGMRSDSDDYAVASLPFAFILSDSVNPPEIWRAALVGSETGAAGYFTRLSRHDESSARAVSFVEPQQFTCNSFDGTPIQGWLMKPANWEAGKKYPLILSVHGGPHGSYGYGFNAAFQAYAARGYAVLFLNPRGSTGYGQKFSDGTLREWGGGDYKDLMAGVDEALRLNSWLDGERMGVAGGSYGGFMTNWIITQTPRFKAAVASASVSNMISFYSTSLYQDLVHAEFGVMPWDDYDLLWRWSPLRYVKNVQTPTLFIHGEQDNDVHITQAEEMYTALKRRGVPTVLARYPREGHGLREPKHRLDALERTLAWFDKYLK